MNLHTSLIISLAFLYPVLGYSADFENYIFNYWEQKGPIGGGGYFWQPNYDSTATYTHTGIDFQVGRSNSAHVFIKNNGFGKISDTLTSASSCNSKTACRVNIGHLLDNGKYVYFNLLHFKSDTILPSIQRGSYITREQLLGREGNTGLSQQNSDDTTHFHFEVSNFGNSSQWVKTSTQACPNPKLIGKSTCANGTTRKTNWDYGDLLAYYSADSSGNAMYTWTDPDGVSYTGQAWYDPDTLINNHEEMFPYISRQGYPTSSPSMYDIYGIQNLPIYAHLNAKGSFSDVGVVIRKSGQRKDATNTATSLSPNKYLIHGTKMSATGGIDGYISIPSGDYLLVPYALPASETKTNYGYPTKFSVVNSGTIIVDNDQSSSSSTVGSRYSEGTGTAKAVEGTLDTVPGYYLTARLVPGRSTAFAQWSPGITSSGYYKIYAHVPISTSGAITGDSSKYVKLTYKVKCDGTDANLSTATLSTSGSEIWIPLKNGNADVFQLKSSAYVGLALSDKNTGKSEDNYSIDSTLRVPFDAIKFEYLSSVPSTYVKCGK